MVFGVEKKFSVLLLTPFAGLEGGRSRLKECFGCRKKISAVFSPLRQNKREATRGCLRGPKSVEGGRRERGPPLVV